MKRKRFLFMKVLVICDDFYHHGDVIKEGLDFLQDEFDMTYAMDMTEYSFTAKPLSGYNVVVIAKENLISNSNKDKWFDENIEKQFEDYVNNGGGLLFLHAGTVLCREFAILKSICGCAFIHHPEQCVVDFNITSSHSVTNEAENFAEKDEHYFIDFIATDADIFLESRSENGVQPAGYTRIHNERGRVCVLTPGHNLSVFKNEQYKKIIRNAVNWCAINPFNFICQ
jgi:type 1 glutamine amidotransferase